MLEERLKKDVRKTELDQYSSMSADLPPVLEKCCVTLGHRVVMKSPLILTT